MGGALPCGPQTRCFAAIVGVEMIRKISRVMAIVVSLSLFQGILGFAAPTVALAATSGPAGFVSGQWLIVAQQATIADSFADLKLKEQAGKQWVVVVADVTNTGSNASFSATGLEIGSLDNGASQGIAPNSFLSDVKLSAAKVDITGSVAIVDSATERIAAAYSIDKIAEADTSLIFGDQVLPLENAFVDKIDVAALDAPAPLVISPRDRAGNLRIGCSHGCARYGCLEQCQAIRRQDARC